MQDELFQYTIDFDVRNINLHCNGVLLFSAKIKSLFLREAYKIRDTQTQDNYRVSFYKKGLFYHGDEKIVVYNTLKESISEFTYNLQSKNSTPVVQLVEAEKQISLSTQNKIELEYKDAEYKFVVSYTRNYFTSDSTYKFTTTNTIPDYFKLIICCFCHKNLLKPHFW